MPAGSRAVPQASRAAWKWRTCLNGLVALRDSKDVSKAPHVFNRREWIAFLAGVRNGEFDLPVG